MRRSAGPALLLAAAFVLLRLVGMGTPSLGVDDGVSLLTASRPLGEIVPYMLGTGEVHPPLYFYWLHPWTSPPRLGAVETWFRSSNLPWAAAIVLLTGGLGRELLGRRGAWAAMALTTASAYLGYYAWELRMYPMLTALVLGAAWAATRLAREDRAPLSAAALAVLSTLAIFTHYLGILYVAAIAVFLAINRRRALLPLVLPLLALAAWVPVLQRQLSAQQMTLRDVPGWPQLVELSFQMGFGVTWPLPLPGWPDLQGLPVSPSSWTGLLVVAAACVGLWRVQPPARTFLVTVLLVPIGAVIAVSALTTTRIFEYKYFQTSAPFLFLALAGLISERWESRRAEVMGALVLGLICAGNVTAWANFQKQPDWYGPQDWRGVLRRLAADFQPADRVVVHPSMMAAPVLVYAFYETRQLLPAIVPADAAVQVPDVPRVWLLTTPAHPYVAQQRLLPTLEAKYRIVQSAETSSHWPANRIAVYLLEHR